MVSLLVYFGVSFFLSFCLFFCFSFLALVLGGVPHLNSIMPHDGDFFAVGYSLSKLFYITIPISLSLSLALFLGLSVFPSLSDLKILL